ncbi:hypothetical protein HPB47_011859 [Ixodes persulcatus]|uniref:Uncharacterized protein n=1 Tax=Ixodes persulcatus TaxID=34615 RepID=A0AC60NV83_IXOPE|nr:hypothetical protein HPB47_011859 [Ixodes persulcatus]
MEWRSSAILQEWEWVPCLHSENLKGMELSETLIARNGIGMKCPQEIAYRRRFAIAHVVRQQPESSLVLSRERDSAPRLLSRCLHLPILSPAGILRDSCLPVTRLSRPRGEEVFSSPAMGRLQRHPVARRENGTSGAEFEIPIDPAATRPCDRTTASLKGKVMWREGELVFVRKLGTSNVAVLTFVGRRVPRYVHYNCPSHRLQGLQRKIPPASPPRNLATRGPQQQDKQALRQRRQATGPATGNKASYSEKNKNRKASTRSAKSGARTKAPFDNAGDLPPLESAHTKVSGWVGAVPGPLSPSPSPTEIALQKQNAELRRQTEILANKIQAIEAKLARLTEPQAQNGPSEPMQQAEPADHEDRASVASGSSSVSQCSGRTSVGRMPLMEHRLENLERTIADMPDKILEGVRASFRELWQQELPHMLQRITPAVTDSVLSTVQKRSSVQYESSRSRSREGGFLRQTTGSLEHSPAAPCPEMMVPLPEAPSPSGVRRAPHN